MNWKKWPYWTKGAAIGFLFSLILLISIAVAAKYEITRTYIENNLNPLTSTVEFLAIRPILFIHQKCEYANPHSYGNADGGGFSALRECFEFIESPVTRVEALILFSLEISLISSLLGWLYGKTRRPQA